MPYTGVLNKEYVDLLIAAETHEGPELDYKRELPGSAALSNGKPNGVEDPLDKFAESITAFANSSGGILIFGLDEDGLTKKPRLFPIKGPPFDTARNRLGTALNDRIEPRIVGIEFKEITVDGGYLLAIRVPQTADGPHWSGRELGKRRFKVRIDDSVRNMTHQEVRAAFDRNASATSRAVDWISARVDSVNQGHPIMPLMAGPKIVIHAVPMVSYFQAHPSMDVHEIQKRLIAIPRPWFESNATSTVNFEGAAVYSPNSGRTSQDQQPGYAQFFRNGAVESVAIVNDVYVQSAVSGLKVAHALYDTFSKLPQVLNDLGKPGPLLFSIALLHVHGRILSVGGESSQPIRTERRDMIAEPTYIEDPTDQGRLNAASRDYANLIWQGFQFDDCHFIDSNGRWKPF